jgi:hypothetical protein
MTIKIASHYASTAVHHNVMPDGEFPSFVASFVASFVD